MGNKVKLAFDIDDTITRWCHSRDYVNYEAIPGMVETINQLYDDGYYIILFTARGMTSVGPGRIATEIVPDLVKNLNFIGLKYHELITHKPSYDLFVDDKAIHPQQFLAKINSGSNIEDIINENELKTKSHISTGE